MNMTIHCQDLCLTFGETRAIDEVTTAVGGRKIIGLLGRNGSGKTTLLNTMAGLLRPTWGTCRVFDRPSTALRREDMSRLGVVHQEGTYVESMTVQMHLDYIASFYDRWDKERQRALLGDLGLNTRERVSKLSTGDKQKLGIILAVCHHPDLLLLDEPASALDPIARQELIRLLFEIVQEDEATIVVSSHVLMDVEKVIDHVWFMRRGKLIMDQSLDTVLESHSRWEIEADHPNSLPPRFSESFVLDQAGSGDARTLVVCAGAQEMETFSETHRVQVTSRALNLEGLFPAMAKR